MERETVNLNRPARSVHIRTPSRLHFGLLSVGSEGSREFGGVGLMIEGPGVSLAVRGAAKDEVMGEAPPETLARVRCLLRAVRDHLHLDQNLGFAVELFETAPEHHGLGTGTQLSLAVASAICQLLGEHRSPMELARMTGRGKRSGLGVHGFHSGGFLVDGGKGPNTCLAPAIARMDFPPHWPVLLVRPELPVGLSGVAEQKAFGKGLFIPSTVTDRLARIVLLEMLPALAEIDYPSFGEALFAFNRLVGESFATAQGGTYAAPLLSAMVDAVRGYRIPAVGQSSWGPTLFILLPDLDQAAWLQSRLADDFSLSPHRLFLTQADNVGAHWQREPAHA